MYLTMYRQNLLILKLMTGRLHYSCDIFQQQFPAASTSSLMKRTKRKKKWTTKTLCPSTNHLYQLEEESCQGFGSTATVSELKSHQPCLSCLNFHILGERQLDTLLNSYAWMQRLLSVHFPKIFLGELSNTVIAYQTPSLCDFREVLCRLNCVKEGQAIEWEQQDPSVNLGYVFSNYSTLPWGWLQVALTSLTIQHRLYISLHSQGRMTLQKAVRVAVSLLEAALLPGDVAKSISKIQKCNWHFIQDCDAFNKFYKGIYKSTNHSRYTHSLKVIQMLYFSCIENVGTFTMNNLSFCCGDNETKNGKQEVSIYVFPLQSTDLHRSVHNISCCRLPTTYCYSFDTAQSQLAQFRLAFTGAFS